MKLELKLTNDWIEAIWYNEDGAQVYCESFSGHSEHISMLRAKASEYYTILTVEQEELISECTTNFVYPAEPTDEEIATKLKEECNAPILLEISNIEAKTLRSIRETFSLDNTTAQNAAILLKHYDDQIIALRSTLL